MLRNIEIETKNASEKVGSLPRKTVRKIVDRLRDKGVEGCAEIRTGVRGGCRKFEDLGQMGRMGGKGGFRFKPANFIMSYGLWRSRFRPET